jgi:hypothetical protein
LLRVVCGEGYGSLLHQLAAGRAQVPAGSMQLCCNVISGPSIQSIAIRNFNVKSTLVMIRRPKTPGCYRDACVFLHAVNGFICTATETSSLMRESRATAVCVRARKVSGNLRVGRLRHDGCSVKSDLRERWARGRSWPKSWQRRWRSWSPSSLFRDNAPLLFRLTAGRRD